MEPIVPFVCSMEFRWVRFMFHCPTRSCTVRWWNAPGCSLGALVVITLPRGNSPYEQLCDLPYTVTEPSSSPGGARISLSPVLINTATLCHGKCAPALPRVRDVTNTGDFHSFALFIFIPLVLSGCTSSSPEEKSSQCLFQVEQFHYSLSAD